MVNLMRKYQQTLMLLVTIVVIICFAWLYNDTRFDRLRYDYMRTLYGRSISTAEFERGKRKFDVAYQLRMIELLEGMVLGARSMMEAKDSFSWNTLILRHEGDRLGIQPTDAEVIATVQQLPVFQTRGVYDSSKYNAFIANEITPRGFSPDEIEEIVRDDLRLRKIKNLLGATIDAAPSEVREAFELRNRKTEISVVRLKLEDFLSKVQVSDEELKKLYEERKDTLKSDELRKVKYVAFVVPKSEKPLVGKERVEAMQKLADRASEFSVAMTEKEANFDEVAKKFNAEPKESPDFALAAPPAELEKSQEVARTAFEKLTKDQPNSDVIMTDNGYYVLQLVNVTPARPLSFDEAKAKLAEQVKDERARETMNLKIAEVRTQIEAALKAGKSLPEAATAAGVQLEKMGPFSLAEPGKLDTPDAGALIGRSLEMAEGQLSEPIPTGTGVALIHVDKRDPIDEEKFKQEKELLVHELRRGKTEAVFLEWLKGRRRAANLEGAQA